MMNLKKILKLPDLCSDYFRGLKHLVHCQDATDYESFLLVKNDRISLHTMKMFTEKQCNEAQLLKINLISRLESKWKTEKFFMPRIENFHGCELRIGFDLLAEDKLPFSRLLDEEDGFVTAEGAIIDMIQTLSTHLNFTATYKGSLNHNNITTYDVKINADQLGYYDKSCNPSSDPIFTSSVVFVVPPGTPYTPWEKLFLPFDWETWMWLGITFAVAFLIIALIKIKRSDSMYEFVIGSNVTTPSLNVVAIFMGIGQILLPQRSVTRFLFINFILFSLIMRTAYQGKYFEFLTSGIRRKPIQTLEELRDKSFTAIWGEPDCFECQDDLKEQG